MRKRSAKAVAEAIAEEIERLAYEHGLVVGESPFDEGTWWAGNDRGISHGLRQAARIAREIGDGP